jgi:hypothetical protein
VIWVGPGDFVETVIASVALDASGLENLTIQGHGPATVIRTDTSAGTQDCLRLGNGATLRDVQIQTRTGTYGTIDAISCDSSDDITIENSKIIAARTALAGTAGRNLQLRNSHLFSHGDPLSLGTRLGFLVDNCTIYTDCQGNSNSADHYCLAAPGGEGVVRGGSMIAKRSDQQGQETVGVHLTGSKVLLDGVTIVADQNAAGTGDVIAARIASSGDAYLRNCHLISDNAGTGNTWDIEHAGGTLRVWGSSYDPAKATGSYSTVQGDVDFIWDEPLASHTTLDTPGDVLNKLIRDSATLPTDVNNGSILGQMIAKSSVSLYDRTKHSLEGIGRETILINTTSTAQPAAGDITASGSMADTLAYVRKFMMEKNDNDGSTITVYGSDGTPHHTASASEVGGTVTRGRFGA